MSSRTGRAAPASGCRTTSDAGHVSVGDGETFEKRLAESRRLISDARFADAIEVLDELLTSELPASLALEARYAKAVALRYAGQPVAALDVLTEITTAHPAHSRAFQERGHALVALDRTADAAAAYGKALALNPGLLASWKAIQALHEQHGNSREATLAGEQVEYLTALPPDLRGAIDLLHEGKLYKAEQVCRRYLRAHPRDIEGMRLLAEVGSQLRVLDDAEFLLESCVALDPEHVRARSDYLAILNRKGKFAKAYEQAKTLYAGQPSNPVFRLAMANALNGLGRTEEALAIYGDCLTTVPNKAGVHVLIGHARKTLGDVAGAVEAYRSAYAARPDYGDAFWSLANMKTYAFTDKEFGQIKRLESDEGTDVDDRIHLCFAAGKAFEDRSEFDESFEFYARGNLLKHQQLGYDPSVTTAMVDAQIEHCTRELFEQRGNLGCQSPDPIFIVGLPRAGSTLLEQILASHPDVDGTMELHEILGLAQRLRGRAGAKESRYPRILAELDDEYFAKFGEQFIETTRVYRGDAPRFIDKMPNNFLHIGLILLILPNAKIIDARRHPMACCFSGFKQLFGEGQDFSYDLTSVGCYYRDYVRLMDHWDAVVPGRILRVMHEDVVADLETQVRRMLEFCELPFDPACLAFHQNRRKVRTPSAEQVRQPIYRTGLEQWRHYDAQLEPLKAALGDAVLARYPIDGRAR